MFSEYQKIRDNVKNGLAIVAVERGAAGGSYFTIPPQMQMEIAARQKIITDEHSGRILVDSELATEEKEKMIEENRKWEYENNILQNEGQEQYDWEFQGEWL